MDLMKKLGVGLLSATMAFGAYLPMASADDNNRARPRSGQVDRQRSGEKNHGASRGEQSRRQDTSRDSGSSRSDAQRQDRAREREHQQDRSQYNRQDRQRDESSRAAPGSQYRRNQESERPRVYQPQQHERNQDRDRNVERAVPRQGGLDELLSRRPRPHSPPPQVLDNHRREAEMRHPRPDGRWDYRWDNNRRDRDHRWNPYYQRRHDWGWGFWLYTPRTPYWPMWPSHHPRPYGNAPFWWGQDWRFRNTDRLNRYMALNGCFQCHEPVRHHYGSDVSIGIWFRLP